METDIWEPTVWMFHYSDSLEKLLIHDDNSDYVTSKDCGNNAHDNHLSASELVTLLMAGSYSCHIFLDEPLLCLSYVLSAALQSKVLRGYYPAARLCCCIQKE